MKTVLLKNIAKYDGKKVTIKGWMFNRRSSGKIHFLQLTDGTGNIQGIATKSDVSEKVFELMSSINLQSSVVVTGKVKEEKRSPSGYDLIVSDLEVVQMADEDYPIGKKEHGVSFLLDQRHLWLRADTQRAIQSIRHQIIYAIYDYYNKNDFIKIDTPIITPNACEGTTDLFELDYFGDPGFLSQSGQLYLEAAIFSVNRCFDFAPVFRAEKSKTRRHLTEFWMTNAEAAYVEHKENLDIQEGLVLHILDRVLTHNLADFEVLGRDIEPLKKIKGPFPRITFQEAVKQLRKLGSDIKDGEDFGNDDETVLMNHYDQPLFVEFYPAEVKAFYMKRHPDDNSLAMCADLLVPEGYGEMIGGSEREADYETLLKAVKKHNLPVEDFQWYLDLRKYGSVPHSGFGLGLERAVAWICGLKHVRETIPFPRLLNRMRP